MSISFIEFLAKEGGIKFGDFTLKSGRESPYFIDVGNLTSGFAISELGRYYAAKIHESFGDDFDVIFGPAYKAIPLAIATTIALKEHHGINKRWLFDRKEMKLHGADASSVFVGSENLDLGQRVLIIDDVITDGTTKIEAINKLKKALNAKIVGLVIAVDRKETGKSKSAIEEFTEQTDVPVFSITDIDSIFNHLHGTDIEGTTYVNDKTYQRYKKYKEKYGV